MTHIILDSSPLGLLFHRVGLKEADNCRSWLRSHVEAGDKFYLPEIIDYELRRELLRLHKANAIQALDEFARLVPDRFIPLDSATLRFAAELWADARQRGQPTAPDDAIDIDVILAAQVIRTRFPVGGFVVATSNLSHLSRFVPAEVWSKI